MVSLLKAWWGSTATKDNDFCYGYLPRLTGSHSTFDTVLAQLDGVCTGYLLLGQNPAVGSANARMQRLGMANLDWLVVRDFSLTESATWWRNGPEIETGEMRTEDLKTEVFFLPAAAQTEKDGSFTNTQRLLQWHHAAVEPAGDARSDLWFIYHLGLRIRQKLAAAAAEETAETDRPVLDLTWDYPVKGRLEEPDAEAVLAEINGWNSKGEPLSSYTQLKHDGSTTCGCWIYCGVYAGGVNQAARRVPGGPRRTRTAGRGASARPSSGGTPETTAGPGPTCPTSSPTGRRTTPRPTARPAWPRSPVRTRSSCRPTARRGCSPRPAWSTGRCPHTTSRRSPRSPTCSTASSTTRSGR
jgi:formate dehydrogenase major subunit